MKKVITYIMIFLISFFSYGKKVDSTLVLDKLSFHYINVYRDYHGIDSLVWSDKLYKISVSHTDKLISYNKTSPKITLFHSHTGTHENTMMIGWNGKSMGFVNHNFYTFIDEYFGLTKGGMTRELYTVLLPIYSWHNSKKGHKETLLNPNLTKGSIHINSYLKTETFNGKYTYSYEQLFSTSNFK